MRPRHDVAALLVVGLAVLGYVAVFGVLTWRHHDQFGTFGFDMGIHDQGIWLLSRFREPFVTVRGLHYFGHHLNLVSLLLVPAYWLGAGPGFLAVVQTVFLAAGAVPVYLLGRDLFGDRTAAGAWLPVVPALGYLLHPTLTWVNWWHFHPESFAVAPLLTAVWLARRRRWWWFAVAVAFALSAKEDIALAVAMLGVLLLVPGLLAQRRHRGWWRAGAATAVIGLAWYVVATQVVMPAFNGGGQPFYVQEFFPEFGDDAPSVMLAIVTDPGRTLELLTDGDRLAYYGRLLAPVGFLGLLGLPFLALAGPQLAANALSGLSTTYDARFHYSLVPLVGVFVATVHGLALLRRWHRRALHLGLVVLAASSVATHREWSPSPAGRAYDSGIWAPARADLGPYRRAVARVPSGAGVAATYFVVPHLTHRPRVYEWPNPWVPGNWGIGNRHPDDPDGVDYLVLDLTLDQEPGLVARLLAPGGGFEEVSREGGVLVARRTRSPAR